MDIIFPTQFAPGTTGQSTTKTHTMPLFYYMNRGFPSSSVPCRQRFYVAAALAIPAFFIENNA